MLPLDNIKVIDLSARAPGPFCTMALSDMGAEVLAVEAPSDVDIGEDLVGGPTREARAANNPLRRNKRSIILNLKQAEGREILSALAKGADVFIEGFRPGVADRLGVGYAALRAVNRRLVYCSISGYGQDGPYRVQAGHDINYISFAGVLGMVGSRDGTPAVPLNLVADLAAGGVLSAYAILTALWARQRTGEGQRVDMSMMDGSLYLMAPFMGAYFATGQVPERGRDRLGGGYPDYQAYECRDGKYLSVGCFEAKFWKNLCIALGREDFVPWQHDTARHEAMVRDLQAVFKTRKRDEWFEYLIARDIPVGKVYSIDEVPLDPQVRARGLIAEVPDSQGRPIRQVNIAPRLSATPGRIQSIGSPPGTDTKSVLRELGYDEASIERLHRSGAVG